MAKRIKSGNEVKAGDALHNFIDGAHIGDVLAVRPYAGPLIGKIGEGSQIASFYGGKEMTLAAVSYYEVRSGVAA